MHPVCDFSLPAAGEQFFPLNISQIELVRYLVNGGSHLDLTSVSKAKDR